MGGEYLIVVALSKDTAVGLSNTLNVGASNKVRVAENSSESVGGNKKIDISGSLQEKIDGYYTVDIGKNYKLTYGVYSKNNISITSDEEYLLASKCGINISSEEDSISIMAKNNTALSSNDIFVYGDNDIELSSGNNISIKTINQLLLDCNGISIELSTSGLKLKAKDNELNITPDKITIKGKVELKNEFNKLIDEDMSSSLKLVTKSNTYSPEYEQDSIYSFIVPDTEKLLSFHINIDNEDYISIISNTPYDKKSYRSIIGNFINKTNIPSIYAFHKSAQYTITELNVYHLDDNLNKLFNDDYERYFYKSGSFIELELKLKDDKVVDVDQIQWGIISWHDLYSIERESKHDSLSSEYSSSIQEKLINKFTDIGKEVISKEKNRYIYKLPNYQQNEPHELYLFTYISKDEITKYNSVKLCINDYTQVVIDVTLAEALRAETEVAQLGWATSYVLQRLWHDK